jgi:ADP-heptose:LPS heptosyltransferase
MKILVLQLARLGDIYLSWPALNALKRNNPQAEIVLLTRAKFAAAAKGLTAVSEVIEMPTKDILAPLIQDTMDIPESHRQLSAFVESLRARNFDRVINLSFSPASAYLTHLLQPDSSKVCGYSRTEDGFLAIPDDMSAYFYAQVGPGKPNRFHLAEIFGTLCGVDLVESDWKVSTLPNVSIPVSGPYVALHIGASEAQKSISPEKWISILSHFRTLNSTPVVLIGSAFETPTAEKILSATPTGQVISLVGATTLSETMAVVQKAALLVGPDSAPMHMASLTGTRCLNLSLGRVNFWETGPRASGSWIVRASKEVDLASDRISRAMAAMLEKLRPEIGIIQVQQGTPSYSGLFPKEAEFHWKLTQAIYQGTPFPEPVSNTFWEAHTQLCEINAFLIEQLTALENGASLEQKAAFIDRGEEVIEAIAKLVPSWGPAIRWYQTEKVRIGPGEPAHVLKRTLEIQKLFQQVLDLYSDLKEVPASAEREAP